jgi:hypothetical protein
VSWKVTVVDNKTNEVLDTLEYDDHPDPEELGQAMDDAFGNQSITIKVEEVEEDGDN